MKNAILSFLIAIPTLISAQSTISDGNYHDPNIWDCNCVPISGFIQISHEVDLTADLFLSDGNFIISSGGSLSDGLAGHTVELEKMNMVNNGTIKVRWLNCLDSVNVTNQSGLIMVEDLHVDTVVNFLNNDSLWVTGQCSNNGQFSNGSSAWYDIGKLYQDYDSAAFVVLSTTGRIDSILNMRGTFNTTHFNPISLSSDHVENGGVMIIRSTGWTIAGDLVNRAHLQIWERTTEVHGNVTNDGMGTSGAFLHANDVTTVLLVHGDFYTADTTWFGAQICVGGNSTNDGYAYVRDFCDQSGNGQFDINNGVISVLTMYCQSSCNLPSSSSVSVVNKEVEIFSFDNMIQFKFTSQDEGELNVYSADGKLVVQQPVHTGKTTIETTDLPKGLYLYNYSDKSGVISTGKLIF